MTLREVDQFLVDPITEPLYPDGKIVCEAIWLQSQLRELDVLRKKTQTLEDSNATLRETNSQLRNTLVIMESKSPYTYLNVKA